jgi:two-component system cell cycle sensor histidine kinase/response regulator CckA
MSRSAPATVAALADDWRVLAAGVAVSVLLVALITREAALVAGFAGGLLGLGLLARAALARPVADAVGELAAPDWSVTVAALEGGDTAVAITDRAGRLVCANRRFEATFGVGNPPPRLALDSGADGLADAMRAAWRDGVGRAGPLQAGGTRWQGEVTRAGRGEDYLVWRLAPLLARDPLADLAAALAGKPGRMLGAAGFAAALVEPDGRIRAANHTLASRIGLAAARDAVGRDFANLLVQDDEGHLFWANDRHHVTPLTLFFVSLADPDSTESADPQGAPSLMLLAEPGMGLGGDTAPAAAAPQLEALLAGLPLGLAMADRDGRLLFANPAFLRAAGREGEVLPGWPTDLVVREDKAALSDAVRRYAMNGAGSGDIAVRLVGLGDDPVMLGLSGVRGLGEATVLLSLADSTEETRLKRQVAQATKMQAVGQLAGGVAHDFNNVLTAILGTCDLMLLRHMPGDSDYDDIQQIRANSNRAASLTRQLLAFSRQQTLRPEVLQLPDVVSEISQMLRRLIGEKIQLVVTHDRELGAIRADPTQLEQVIVNLVVNARDAIHEQSRHAGNDGVGGGRLLVATRRVPASAVRAMGSDVLPVGDYTALVVEDTGGGITPENLAKIWDPFFTTKEPGRGGSLGGTGLGLSTVYGIVKQSGGYIFAESEPGHGARFTIYFPVHHAPAEAPRIKETVAASWAGGGDLLLVEDEDAVRLVAERALTRAGYTVTTARDGEEGLELFEARAASGGPMYDLVVSDVVMPGMDGPAMVRAMRERSADLPVLFMSGHAEEQLRREIDIANTQFIGKPFSVQQIGDKVAGVLRARG